jgi:class 3 adenylate cyclase/tetratricopeptide (TPR) repeat protein
MAESAASRVGVEAGERRFITIEFIDLVGYTDLSERLDAEDLGVLLRRYQRLALTTMERFGGFVAQAFGDGILVYFGYPAAHGNDAERALLAALALQEGLRELDTTVHGRALPRLEARIGVHSGLVQIAEELMLRHGAVGEAINVASRIQALASPGAIAISQETQDLVEGLFDSRSLGSRSVKGLSRKIEVYEVTRALPGKTRTGSRLQRGAARLVGREDKLSRLVSRWQAAKSESRCQTVTVLADAGVGKTRLVMEALGRPELGDATLFLAHCQEIYASTPLYPVATFLRSRAGLTVDDDETQRREKISGYLDELGRNTQENRELVAGLLSMGVRAVAEGVAATPQLIKRRQCEFVISMIEAAASRRPVFLWVEDAHWLDPSSAELLRDLVAAVAKLPVLVVLSMRAYPRGPALPPIDETVQLDPLERSGCLELARSVPGAIALSEQMISKAVDAAEGVPFFVEQLVISLLDEQARGPATHRRLGGVPLALAELMSERLDRRPGARRIAQAAACIGGAFTPEFLRRLLEDDAQQITERLAALVEAEILLPRRYGAEIRYEFRHALLQMMAHESMVQSERRAVHSRIARVLRHAEGAEPAISEVLAHHLTEAGEFTEAIGAWLQAAVAAGRRSAHVEAIGHSRRGLALIEHIADPGVRRRFELNLQVSMMGSLLATLSATSPELEACCARGLQLCKEDAATPLVFPLAFGQFTFVNCRGRCSEAISLASEFVERAERGKLESERVIGYRMLGQAHLANGDAAAAKTALERSLALYVAERDAATTHLYGQNTEVHTKSLLSLTHLCAGDVDGALKAGVDALRTADGVSHPHSTAIPMTYVGGWVFGLCGAIEQMMAEAKNLLALADQHHLYGFRAHASAFIGWALCQAGNPAQGIPMIAKAIEAFDSVKFRLSVGGHLANLADAQRRIGRLNDALVSSERALQLMPEGSAWLEPELRRVHALVEADLPSTTPGRAEAGLRSAVASAVGRRFPVQERSCLVSLQQHLAASGRRDATVEARLAELSHLDGLARRVASAMQVAPHA